MGRTTRTVFFGVLCVICVQGIYSGKTSHHQRVPRGSTNQTEKGDFGVLIARLNRLEAQIDKRVITLRDDIRSARQSIATRNGVEGFQRFPEGTSRNYQQELGSQNAQLADTESLKPLYFDLAIVKQDLATVANLTNDIRDQLQTRSAIQDILKPKPTPANCLEIHEANNNALSISSVYLVHPTTSKKPFLVYCDMTFRDGGWLTIHNRFSGEQDFYRDWQDYKIGFGNIAGEHWLGLEHIYELTGGEIYELAIQLGDVNKDVRLAYYSHFSIGSEEEGYSLKVLGGFFGDAGDSLSYHAGSKFSTKDKDQDSWVEGDCAKTHGGAWWYKSCDKSNLNGKYLPGVQEELLLYQPMYWDSFSGPQVGLKYARMMIRPRRESTMATNYP